MTADHEKSREQLIEELRTARERIAELEAERPHACDHDADGSHYLERELRHLIRTDPDIVRFLEQSSLDGIWYWDLENPDHEWLSPEFWRLFGYKPEEKEHLAAEWQDMIFPEDLATAVDNFNKHCANPDHPYDQLVRYRHRDGSTVWVRCRGIAIRDESGRPLRMLGAHNDFTELKRLEAIREDVDRIMRHDLKGALSGIIAIPEMLAWTGSLTEQERELLMTIREAGRRMLRLVDASLSLYKLETGDFELDLGRMNVFKELKNIEGELTSILRAKDLTVDYRHMDRPMTEAESPVIIADATLFPSMLSNLVKNAVEAAPRESTITVETTLGERLDLVMTNPGRVPESIEDSFFEKYVTHGKRGGTGLGTYSARLAARAHGGDASMTTSHENGTVVTVSLPADPRRQTG
jgi:PAS domain S-box-containing protein